MASETSFVMSPLKTRTAYTGAKVKSAAGKIQVFPGPVLLIISLFVSLILHHSDDT
jgi:hypothetical protein